MKIIFLHGLESTPETSSTAKLIKDNFEKQYEVIVPDYKPSTKSYEEIVEFLKGLDCDYRDIVIGISLGGFWALHMTEFTNATNVILLNPAIERGEIRYDVKLNTSVEVCGHMLLNMDDEVVINENNLLRYEGRFKIDTFRVGGHRMTNLYQLMPLIDASVEHFESFIL